MKSAASKKRLITPEDLLRFIIPSQPRISHDGSDILFARKHIGEKNKSVTNLWIVPAKGGHAEPTRSVGVPRQFTSGEADSGGQWNADDSRIAFIRTNKDKGESQVFIISRAGGEARQLTHFPEGSIESFKWSPDGRHLVVSFRETHADWTKEAEKKRKDSGESEPPRVIDDMWYRLDGDGYFGAQRHALYLVDAESGEHTPLFNKDNLGHHEFDFSPDSKTLVVSANPTKNALVRPWNNDLYLVDVKSKKSRTVPNLPKGPKALPQWSRDGKMIAYAGREGTSDSTYSTENLELWVCDPKTGKARSLTGAGDYCMLAITLGDAGEAVFGPNFRWHPDSKRIIAQIGWRGESHLASIDVASGKVAFLTSGAIECTLGNISSDGKAAVVRADPVTLPEVGIATLSKSAARLTVLTSFNKELLSELDLAKPESKWIKSGDGNDVHVWIMKPPRARSSSSTKKLPAVLEIHGGPHALYGSAFFHEFQTLAAAGYVVFYSNPRGSKGYGRDHCHAIRGSWGDRDWVDLQAVIGFMLKHPQVDPKRMGVMGGSYGGYMTNWIIGHTNTFAGAITDRCVSNLISMWGNSDFPGVENKYWQGNPWDKPETLWKWSPIRLMNKAKTPTLIIHSEGDLRCNIEQAEQVFTALKSRGVPTRFVRYPRTTSHGMSRMGPPDLRLHRLREILDWWKEWLGG